MYYVSLSQLILLEVGGFLGVSVGGLKHSFADVCYPLHRFTSVFFYTDEILKILPWNKALS